MARTVIPLNNTQIKQAKPKDKEYNLSDGQGLMLRVSPSGGKSWYFNYYHPHTKKRKAISLGNYPDLSLAEAREIRRHNRALLANNIDPQENRNEEKIKQKGLAERTFEVVARQWMELHSLKVQDSTLTNIERYFEKDVFPYIGKTPISQITAPKAIQTIQTVIDRQSHEIARKLARRMNSVMTFAVNAGLVQHNPLTGIRELIPTTKVKHQPSLKPDELPDLIKAIRYSSTKIVTRCLIEWQLHTMVRPAEAAEMEWEELDLDGMLWTIPAARMKMEVDHTIPLTEQAVTLLNIVKPISGHRKYVFPSHNDPKKPSNKQTANMALKRMGFSGRQTAHGLRSLASTTLNEQGFDADIVEAALAHKDKNEIRSAYNRAKYLERRRVMMCWWSEHIEWAASSDKKHANTKKALRLVNG